jgi:GNAT superfamily N-acetyltransferase
VSAASSGDVIVRRLLPDEWSALREARLTALREAPSAYGATYEETAALPDDQWRQWVERDSVRSAMFGARRGAEHGARADLARADRPLVGLCGGWLEVAASGADSATASLAGARRDAPVGAAATVDLVFVWVSPRMRRRGLGTALVEQVLAWARAQGAARVHLRVTDGNLPAERLYTRSGFVRTGEQVPHPSAPGQVKADMVRSLR